MILLCNTRQITSLSELSSPPISVKAKPGCWVPSAPGNTFSCWPSGDTCSEQLWPGPAFCGCLPVTRSSYLCVGHFPQVAMPKCLASWALEPSFRSKREHVIRSWVTLLEGAPPGFRMGCFRAQGYRGSGLETGSGARHLSTQLLLTR